MILVENLTLEFPEKKVFKEASFEINNGIFLLDGDDKPGKSTLLNLIFNNFNITQQSHYRYDVVKGSNDSLLYFEEMMFPYNLDEVQFINTILEINGLDKTVEIKPIHDNKTLAYYSKLELKTVILKMLFFLNPNVLLLDEPFDQGDDVFNEKILNKILTRDEDKITIVATNNEELKANFLNKIIIRDQKIIVES